APSEWVRSRQMPGQPFCAEDGGHAGRMTADSGDRSSRATQCGLQQSQFAAGGADPVTVADAIEALLLEHQATAIVHADVDCIGVALVAVLLDLVADHAAGDRTSHGGGLATIAAANLVAQD